MTCSASPCKRPRGRRRLTVESYTTKMELDEHSLNLLLWINQTIKQLERTERLVNAKDVNIAILSGTIPQYDAEVCMLEYSSFWRYR